MLNTTVNSISYSKTSMGALIAANINEMTFEDILIKDPKVKALQDACDVFVNGKICESRPFYRLVMGRTFMLMLLFCVIGNFLISIVYQSQQMRKIFSTRLLSAKLIVNTLLMLILLPQALRLCQIWSSRSDFEAFYWQTWPYQIYLVNVLEFCNMWLTVLVIIEYFLDIAYPSLTKLLYTESNIWKCSFAIFLMAVLLHLVYPLNRRIHQIFCSGGRVFHQVLVRTDIFPVELEKLHAWANMLLAIILPLSLLTFMSAYIAWRFLFKNNIIQQHQTREKFCVTRMSLVTTALHLICEEAAVPVFVITAVSGSDTNDFISCYCHTIAHFLGLCNLSLSFYIYFIFIKEFRSLIREKLANVLSPFYSGNNQLVLVPDVEIYLL